MIKETILTLEKAENGEAKVFNHNLGVSFYLKEGQKFGLRYEDESRQRLIIWARSEVMFCKKSPFRYGLQIRPELIVREMSARVVLDLLGESYE